MHPIRAFILNPVKVAVGVLLVVLFGVIALFKMPMQLTPEVEIPTVSVETRWPGHTPHEIETKIVREQQDYLKSVEGVTKMSSECQESVGTITMEFVVGTNMDEAVLKVLSQLQQVRDYPIDVEKPVIRSSSASDRAIAWFILSARPASRQQIEQVQAEHPELDAELQNILNSRNAGLGVLRLRRLAAEHPEVEELLPENVNMKIPAAAAVDSYQVRFAEFADELGGVIEAERNGRTGLAAVRLRRLVDEHPQLAPLLPPDIDVPKERRFAEDFIAARFKRVSGVSNSGVYGGQDPQLQVVIDPHKLAACGQTITDVRDRLRLQNEDTSGGDFWEGKRRWPARVLGRYRSLEQVENVLLPSPSGQSIYVRDVVVEEDELGQRGVRLGHKKPDGFVRRFGVSNIAINASRETGANVIDVMSGLRDATDELNDGVLKDRGLVLTQVYDETDYIKSAVGLVNQNIILGGSLTVIVLMLFLHLNLRTLVFTPLLAGSALLAVFVSPWFFAVTILLVIAAGVWYARGALVVALAIPTSIIGTFLLLEAMGRSLNVISLAGLAFAVGMLVDNAVVVLENVYRHWQAGDPPFQAAERAAKEVWGAVVASTLTTLAVFLPVVFMQEEAGQLFRDIALAICCAVGLSLLVSVTVIPTAAARILPKSRAPSRRENGRAAPIAAVGKKFVGGVVALNVWLQRGVFRRLAVVVLLIGCSLLLIYALRPKVEYLPTGNRNLVLCIIMPPPGYNVEELMQIGQDVEDQLQPYWDVDPGVRMVEDPTSTADNPPSYPVVNDFFYVARGRQVFLGLRAEDPADARKLIDLVGAKIQGKFPGTFVVAFQSSLFSRGLQSGRTIDIEITGPELEQLVGLGGQIIGQVGGVIEPDTNPAERKTQAKPAPSLDLSSPELHIREKPEQAKELGIDNTELGYTVDALVDGAYVTDYYVGGDKIDLVILGNDSYTGHTQDLEQQYVATRELPEPVRLDAFASVVIGSGPEQINHRERQRAITIEVTPPEDVALEDAIAAIESEILAPIRTSGQLGSDYKITMSGTVDKLQKTWDDLFWSLVVALLITYLLMAALFESWVYPFVIIVSVPLGAVGGILGLRMLGVYLAATGQAPQALDVLTMLGFVILIGTAVNNAILIVHQSLNHMRYDNAPPQEAIVESVRTRIRPIFMTTATTCFGLAPLVFFPGAGAELYRGLGSVVLGGLLVSAIFTLVLVPTLFSLTMEGVAFLRRSMGREASQDASDDGRPDARDELATAAKSREHDQGHSLGQIFGSQLEPEDGQEDMLELEDAPVRQAGRYSESTEDDDPLPSKPR